MQAACRVAGSKKAAIYWVGSHALAQERCDSGTPGSSDLESETRVSAWLTRVSEPHSPRVRATPRPPLVSLNVQNRPVLSRRWTPLLLPVPIENG
jgi:hypothetical protein